MQEIKVDSFEEFEKEVVKLENDRERLLNDKQLLKVSRLLFRGQANSKWGLKTTLERFAKDKQVYLTQYYKFAYAAKSKIETFTEKMWEIPNPLQFENTIIKQSQLRPIDIPIYEYLAFLRHHGYPSPLLDWTYSPYIAAFFAFRNIHKETDYVSIYAYLEYAGNGKTYSSNRPCIFSFGPYATIHKRHFLQQSAYTICTVKEGKDFIFAKHDKIDNDGDRQDKIWKFNFPISEKQKVLNKLNQMNINAYSLFLSLDSLMEYVATTEKDKIFYHSK